MYVSQAVLQAWEVRAVHKPLAVPGPLLVPTGISVDSDYYSIDSSWLLLAHCLSLLACLATVTTASKALPLDPASPPVHMMSRPIMPPPSQAYLRYLSDLNILTSLVYIK